MSTSLAQYLAQQAAHSRTFLLAKEIISAGLCSPEEAAEWVAEEPTTGIDDPDLRHAVVRILIFQLSPQ